MKSSGKTEAKKKLASEIAVRIVKGLVSGTTAYATYVIIPQFFFGSLQRALPPAPGGVTVTESPYLATVGIVIFAIAFLGAASYGTIIQGACTVGRTLASIVFLLILTNGGIMMLSLPSAEVASGASISATLTIDFRAFLALYILIAGLHILKGILESTNVLLEKQEKASSVAETPSVPM